MSVMKAFLMLYLYIGQNDFLCKTLNNVFFKPALFWLLFVNLYIFPHELFIK